MSSKEIEAFASEPQNTIFTIVYDDTEITGYFHYMPPPMINLNKWNFVDTDQPKDFKNISVLIGNSISKITRAS